jgi:hypothetical protein
MARLLSRRRVLGVGGAAAIAPAMGVRTAAAAGPAGQVVALRTPVRVYDSRTDLVPLGGAKLGPGGHVIVTVSPATESQFVSAVFLNCSITETEGSGFLVLRPSDGSGTLPFPSTSNINWWASGLTLGNAALVAVGSEFGIEVNCRGAGRTHVIVDVQGYVPITV